MRFIERCAKPILDEAYMDAIIYGRGEWRETDVQKAIDAAKWTPPKK
jgi:hypothetical protein